MIEESATTANTEIREATPPEGMVSTREFVADLQEVAARYDWCNDGRPILERHLPLLKFKPSVYDPVLHSGRVERNYHPPLFTLADGDVPEFLSKKDIQAAAAAAVALYKEDVDEGVQELLSDFDIELIEYDDTWVVTVTVSSKEGAAAGWSNVEHETDLRDMLGDVIADKLPLVTSEDVAIEYRPDPRRPEPTG